MDVSYLQNVSVLVGFLGLLFVLVAFGIGDDAMKRLFPRMKRPQRDRVVSLLIMVGALCAMAGLAGSVRYELGERCPDTGHRADICY